MDCMDTLHYSGWIAVVNGYHDLKGPVYTMWLGFIIADTYYTTETNENILITFDHFYGCFRDILCKNVWFGG